MKKLYSMVLQLFICLSGSIFASNKYDKMQQDANENMRKLLEITDIDWQKIQQYCAKQKAIYSNPRRSYTHDIAIPKDMLEKTCSLLKKYGVEPTSINILATEEIEFAGVTTDELFVNINAMSKMPAGQFEYVLAHEVGHLVNTHSFLVSYFSAYGNLEKPEVKDAFCAWQRNNEIIADQYIISKQGLFALIKHGLDLFKSWCNGTVEDFNDFERHPGHKKRIESLVENLVRPHKELHYLLA